MRKLIIIFGIMLLVTSCGTSDNYAIEFKDCEYGEKELLGEKTKVVCAYVAYTNTSNEDLSFSDQFEAAAFQNDIELNDFLSHELMPDDTNQNVKLKPGASVDVTLAYKLQDYSAVTVELTNRAGVKETCEYTLE